jgi:hypothetical protein
MGLLILQVDPEWSIHGLEQCWARRCIGRIYGSHTNVFLARNRFYRVAALLCYKRSFRRLKFRPSLSPGKGAYAAIIFRSEWISILEAFGKQGLQHAGGVHREAWSTARRMSPDLFTFTSATSKDGALPGSG